MSYDLREYLWIAVLGGIMGFLYGFLIGANDVANAFASSVSSKSITLKQAVLIASVCEFCGAFFLGASVTGTVRNKIFDVKLYTDEPDVLMFGMFTSLLTAVIMLFAATHLGLPVSTTHDIVGCIMGFSIAAKGFSSIDWVVVRQIIISWVASPLVAGGAGWIFFFITRTFVLKTANPYQRAYYTFPIVLLIGIGIDLFFILYKAGNNYPRYKDHLHLYWVLPTSFGTGFVFGLIWIFILGPIAKRRAMVVKAEREAAESTSVVKAVNGSEDAIEMAKSIDDEDEDVEYSADDFGKPTYVPKVNVTSGMVEAIEPTYVSKVKATSGAVEASANSNLEEQAPQDTDSQVSDESAVEPMPRNAIGFLKSVGKGFADSTYNQDLRTKSLHDNPRAAKIWDQGEVYDPDAEYLFSYVQVFTACLNSFAHGANDVSNTIAPTSAIIYIYQHGEVVSKSPVQKWLLAMGGAAIVVGLLLYGYRVMATLGYKLTILSPSRGACAELAGSLTVVTASFIGIPVSTTQCITGAISGVALVGGLRNVQWLMLVRVCIGWVFLFFTGAVLSAGIFSFGAFSPNLSHPISAN